MQATARSNAIMVATRFSVSLLGLVALLAGLSDAVHVSSTSTTEWDQKLIREIYNVGGKTRVLGIGRDFPKLETEHEGSLRSYSTVLELNKDVDELSDEQFTELAMKAWFQMAVLDDSYVPNNRQRQALGVMAAIGIDNYVVLASSVKSIAEVVKGKKVDPYDKVMRFEQGMYNDKMVNGKLNAIFRRPGPGDQTGIHKNSERCGEVNGLRVREDVWGLKPVPTGEKLKMVAFGPLSRHPIDLAKEKKTMAGWQHVETIGPQLGVKDPCGTEAQVEGDPTGCAEIAKEFDIRVIPVTTKVNFDNLGKTNLEYKIIKTNREGDARPVLSADGKAPAIRYEDDQLGLPCHMNSLDQITGQHHGKPTRRSELDDASSPLVAPSGSLAWKAYLARRELETRTSQCIKVKFAPAKTTGTKCRRGSTSCDLPAKTCKEGDKTCNSKPKSTKPKSTKSKSTKSKSTK